jgi:hypothetical protein
MHLLEDLGWGKARQQVRLLCLGSGKRKDPYQREQENSTRLRASLPRERDIYRSG